MKHLKGVHTALITPFTPEDQVDEEGLRLLLLRQIQGNVDGILVLGSTGEEPTLNEEEKKRIIKIAKEECSNKTALMVGTGCFSTRKSIENTRAAEKAGADAALVVVPYYNKPSQEGLYLHFKSIAEATDLPLVIYNNPGRCSQNLTTDTLKRLLEIESIAAVKEASGNISQIIDVIALVKKMRPDFKILSGDDALTLPLMALGGDGVISVISNLLPQEVKKLFEAALSSNFVRAREIHFNLLPFVKMAFSETNPVPIKAILQLYNLPSGTCRPPLSALSQENSVLVQSLLEPV